MTINKDFDIIIQNAHFWNWAPDWDVVRDIYTAFPSAYSVLTPFAFSYLEEMIRSRTSEYGRTLYDENHNKRNYRKVGLRLIELAEKENQADVTFIELLQRAKRYFDNSSEEDSGDNRNSTVHGYMHPRFWTKESFENLIHFIAEISPFAQF